MSTVRNTRILIADDHEMIRVGLRTLLRERTEWSIVGEAADGEAAVTRALETKPHVAIVDYELPLLTGLEVTSEIRKRLPETKVLVFTMHDAPPFAAKAFELGARGYVTKSEANTHLLLAVEALVAGRPYVSPRSAAKLAQSFLNGAKMMTGFTPGARIALELIADGHPDQHIASALDLPADTVGEFRSRMRGQLH